MSRTDKINTEQLREQAAEAGKTAKALADQGKEWATPKVEAAIEWAAPRVDKAWRSGVQAAAPKVADYAERSKGAVDVAHDKLVADVIPKVIAAMEEAAKAAKGGADSLQDKAKALVDDVAEQVVAEPEKKGSALGKTLGWVLVGSAVAGAGVLIWRRTQPVDDPWAEEYWDDAVADGANAASGAASTAAEKVSDAAQATAAAAESATDKAKHVAQDATDAVVDAAEGAADAIKNKADEAKND